MAHVYRLLARHQFRGRRIVLACLAVVWIVSAQCPAISVPTELSLRLTDGANANEGRVEICSGGSWVTTCGSGLGAAEARTICRQLGLSATGAAALAVSNKGQTSTTAVLSLRCPESAQSLEECQIALGGTAGCNSASVAWVRCGAAAPPQQRQQLDEVAASPPRSIAHASPSRPTGLQAPWQLRPYLPPPGAVPPAWRSPGSVQPLPALSASLLSQQQQQQQRQQQLLQLQQQQQKPGSGNSPPQLKQKQSPPPRVRSPPPRKNGARPPPPLKGRRVESWLPTEDVGGADRTATTCNVLLAGDPSAPEGVVQFLRAAVHCRGVGGEPPVPPVNVTVGAQLLPYTSDWQGVRVSQRPADEEWGLTFNDVPYLRLNDSVVQDLPFSRKALLQCWNCSRLDLNNVTVTRLWQPSGIAGVLHGPLHATNLSYALLRNFNCSGVRDAHGWACILLQYNSMYDNSGGMYNSSSLADGTVADPKPTPSPLLGLILINCTFLNNSVSRRGLYGTVHSYKPPARTGPGPSSAGAPAAAAAAPPNPAAARAGLGLVVIAPLDSLDGAQRAAAAAGAPGTVGPSSGRADASSRAALEVYMVGVVATDNTGGLGTVLSTVNLTLESIYVSACTFTGNTAAASGGVFSLGGPVGAFWVAGATRFQGNIAATGDGGALYLTSGIDTLTMTDNSSFICNRAEMGNGGAIRIGGGVMEVRVEAASLLDGNFAGADGGAMAMDGGLGSLLLTGGSTMSRNQAQRGGAVWIGDEATGAVATAPGSTRSAAAVAPRSVTLEGGSKMAANWADTCGGALAMQGGIGQLTLQSGSSLTRNRAVRGGGAVAVLFGDVGAVVLTAGSTIAECSTAYGDGGAVLIAAGSLGRLEVAYSSAVRGNAATAGGGGAFFVAESMGQVMLQGDDSRLRDNVAGDGDGGVLAVGGNLGIVLFSNGGQMRNNTAAGNGGGVAVGGDVTMGISMLDGSGAESNSASNGSGGAFWVAGGLGAAGLTLDGGAFLRDNNASAAGGAVSIGAGGGSDGAGSSTGSAGPIRVRNGSSLYGNVALGDVGGAIAVYGSVAALEISCNGTVDENRAAADGGGLWVGEGLAALRITTNSGASNNWAAGSGGFLFSSAASSRGAAIDAAVDGGSWLRGNVAGLHGGSLMLRAVYGSVRFAEGVTLDGNVAGAGSGGAMCLEAMVSESLLGFAVSLSSVRLEGNRAGKSGGGLYLAPYTFIRNNPSVLGAQKPPNDGVEPRVRQLGAALWSLQISDSVLSRNVAVGGAGGAVLAAAGADAALRVDVVDSTLKGNRAGGGSGGGGVAADGTGRLPPPLTPPPPPPPLQPAGALPRDGDGAAIAVAGLSENGIWIPAADGLGDTPPPDLSDPLNRDGGTCRLTVSRALFSDGAAAASGGALSLKLCTAVVDKSSFCGNKAGVSGGAVVAEAALVPGIAPVSGGVNDSGWWHALLVQQSSFVANTAEVGGGAVATATSGMVRFHGCMMANNSAGGAAQAGGGYGGGIAARPPADDEAAKYGSALELIMCSVASNSAGESGGGVFTGALSVVHLEASNVAKNTASRGGGGGVAVFATSGSLAEHQGGGGGRVPPLTQATNDVNSGLLGAAPQQRRVEIVVRGSILTGNVATQGDGGALYFAAKVVASLLRVVLTGNAAGGAGSATAVVPPTGASGDKSIFVVQECAVTTAGGDDLRFFYPAETVDFVRVPSENDTRCG